MKFNKVLITGDKHGEFYNFKKWCEENNTTKDDLAIILGDSGINYYCHEENGKWFQRNSTDKFKKELHKLPITLFCIHGNHEQRPELICNENGTPMYKEIDFCGGKAYVQEKYPNIIFAKDGENYEINNHHYFVIGGAYSVDKWYRKRMGYNWFASELPRAEEKKRILENIEALDNKLDIILSHTAPLKYEPTEMFLPSVDQSTVDKSMEYFLNSIESSVSYNHWYFGHYHGEKDIDKLTMLFHSIREIK